jgi:hypothetical protein
MIPFLSYWTAGYKGKPNKYIIDLHKVSAFLCKKHYGEVHLLTDEAGKRAFQEDSQFTSIIVCDGIQNLPVEYGGVWSLGKMAAYNYLAKNNIHFVHVDYDVFLFKKLPEFIQNADAFAQSVELNAYSHYNVKSFKKHVPEIFRNEFVRDSYVDYAYNLGIFGGKNSRFIEKYAQTSIDMVLNPNAKNYWSRSIAEIKEDSFMWEMATICEQWYLACFEAKQKSIKVKTLFEEMSSKNLPSEENSVKFGYTHLWGKKNNPAIVDKVYALMKDFKIK